MQVFFKTRKLAREAKRSGMVNIIDNGTGAPKGQRYTKDVQATPSGNNEYAVQCQITDRIIPVFVRGKNKL